MRQQEQEGKKLTRIKVDTTMIRALKPAAALSSGLEGLKAVLDGANTKVAGRKSLEQNDRGHPVGVFNGHVLAPAAIST